MPEVQQRGGVGHACGAQINAGKTWQRLAVVERVFERFVGQPIPLLEEIDAQHPLQTEGRTTALARGIMRLEDGQELAPQGDGLHAGEALFPAGRLLFMGELGVGKRGLVNHARPDGPARPHVQKILERIKSAFP